MGGQSGSSLGGSHAQGQGSCSACGSRLHSGCHSFQDLWRVIMAAWVCLNCRVNEENQLFFSLPTLSFSS